MEVEGVLVFRNKQLASACMVLHSRFEAWEVNSRCKYPMPLCTLLWWMILGSLDIQYLSRVRSFQLVVDQAKRTQVHDVITANSAIIDDDIPGPESDGVPLWQMQLVSQFRERAEDVREERCSPS